MIKNIIFDIGNVLLEFNPKEYFSKYFNDEQKGNDICHKLMHSDIWKKYDLGEYTLSDVMNQFKKRFPEYENDIESVLEMWVTILNPIESSICKIEELRGRGYEVYLLSNLNKEAHLYIEEEYTIFDMVNGYVLSYLERLAKPDEKIYDCLVRRYQLNVHECVFIDDLKENVEAAIAFGMKGIVYTNKEEVEEKLESLLEV